MKPSIVSCKKTGPGHYTVVVERPNYNLKLHQTSVTRWGYVVSCMPVIDAYFGEDPEDADEAEQLIIEEATRRGTKQIIRR